MTDTLMQSSTTTVTTSQQAIGRVTIVPFPGYDMMVWNGPDAAHTLYLGQRPQGSTVFSRNATVISGFSSTQSGSSASRYQNGLINGPSFVMAPDLSQGYVVCVNQSGTVIALPAKMEAVQGDADFWGLVDGWRTVTGSKAAGAPAAAMALQNGQLVLNIVWQDAGAGGMVLAQMEVGNAQETLSFKPLGGHACIGQPSLVMSGGISFLAWTGTDNAFNLAIDPAGGVDFQFDGHYIDSGRGSMYGPCLVPMGGNQLYVLWASQGGIQYAQLAENQFGDWGFNPAPGCAGTVSGSSIALGGPYGVRYDRIGDDGTPTLAVVWPDRTGNVLLAEVPVSLGPVPITQAVF